MTGSQAAARLPSYGGNYEPPNTAPAPSQDAYAAITRAGNDAYDTALEAGQSAFDAYLDTVTTLRAKLNSDELWLCPSCEKVLTSIDTLCWCCECEERDHRDERKAQARLRHGR